MKKDKRNDFAYIRWKIAGENKIPVGIKIQPYNHSSVYKTYMPEKLWIAELDKTIHIPAPSSRQQIYVYIFNHDDRLALKNKNIHIYPYYRSEKHVAFRTNLLYGIDGDGQSIEKFGM